MEIEWSTLPYQIESEMIKQPVVISTNSYFVERILSILLIRSVLHTILILSFTSGRDVLAQIYALSLTTEC